MKKKTNTGSTRASRGVSLDAQTRQICEEISKKKDKEGKKATALLLIADGMKQAEAAHASGLSVWQIRYLLARFRKSGIDIFKNAQELIDSSGIGERKTKRTLKAKVAPDEPGTEKTVSDAAEKNEDEPKDEKKEKKKARKNKKSAKKKNKKKKDKKKKDKKKKDKKSRDKKKGKKRKNNKGNGKKAKKKAQKKKKPTKKKNRKKKK